METPAEPGNSFSQQCSSCDASSARCWCQDCNEALCDDCVSAHRRVTVTRSHRILNQPPAAGGVSTPPIKFCRLHPSEPLKLFCFTCSQLTCRDCQLMAHMNHRYQFVSEALDNLKKHVEDLVQPIRAHRDTIRQSILDMETRKQDVVRSATQLRMELQQSYNILVQHLKKRMEDILEDVKMVSQTELVLIQQRMRKMKQLQQNQQSLTETAEKARTTDDVLALLSHTVQVKSQLKDLVDQDSSPPEKMSVMNVVTDSDSLRTLFSFGKLNVSWVPFSVSPTSNQSRDTPASSSSLPPTSLTLLPQTSTTFNSPVPPAPTTCSTLMSASNQSRSPVTAASFRQPSSSTAETLSNPGRDPTRGQTNQPVSLGFYSSAGPSPSCKVVKVIQPSVGPNQPAAPGPPTNVHTVYRMSYVPEFLSPAASKPSDTTSQKSLFHLLPPPSSSSSSPSLTLSTSTCLSPSRGTLPQTGNTCDSPVPVHCPSTSRSPSSQSDASGMSTTKQHPSCDTLRTSHLEEKRSQVSTSVIATGDQISVGLGPTAPPSVPLSCSSPNHQPQSPVVRAVADSACDRSVQQVAARRQEPAENEPTSTVSEETEPAGKLPAAEEPSSVIGRPDCSLSQWQPTVPLFRLPVSMPPPGCPLPGFRLVLGDAEDEIYLEEMSEDSQSHVDDVTDDVIEPPESPVTLVMVSCSACGSANASIICSACGRGYHRDCHVPPVGPHMWSEWICSLCQDLSDPSDPYSSDRPQRPQSPCLGLQDQRRCESLLLYLKVEGCSRLSESGFVWSQLTLLSERLTLHRPPSYPTAAEFLTDIWILLRDAEDDDVLNKLRDSFQSRLTQTFGSELHPSVLMPTANGEVRGHAKGSEVTSQEQEVVTREFQLSTVRKRLREFLSGPRGSKRTKHLNWTTSDL
ncbi:E3 ubiquitin-protein ligase TRIM33 isoform X1 [Dicentrarchus labrax]|nr:E3 ubiquitin-protein ligase TRIM33 isoform X1 [Dicentrarchus labrax]